MPTYGRYDTISDYIAEREAEAANAGRLLALGVGDADYHRSIIKWCRDRITTARSAALHG